MSRPLQNGVDVMMPSTREAAIRYVMTVLKTATDWQDGQDALSNHDRFGPWLIDTFGEYGCVSEAQSIIREAENRLGDQIPY